MGGPFDILFSELKTIFAIRNLRGVILLTFFDPSYGFRDFWGGWCQNMEFSTPKLMLRSKNVRSMRFWVPKISKGAQKNENMTSVNLMGTSFTGICLVHQLLIFGFIRRGLPGEWLLCVASEKGSPTISYTEK